MSRKRKERGCFNAKADNVFCADTGRDCEEENRGSVSEKERANGRCEETGGKDHPNASPAGVLNMSTLIDGNGNSQPEQDLRELARRIQEETDTNKMIELVQQLIARFDESRSQRPNVAIQDTENA